MKDMSLTKDDLAAIKALIDESEIRINSSFQYLTDEINGVKGELGGLKKDVKGIKRDVVGLRDDITRLHAKVDTFRAVQKAEVDRVDGHGQDIAVIKQRLQIA